MSDTSQNKPNNESDKDFASMPVDKSASNESSNTPQPNTTPKPIKQDKRGHIAIVKAAPKCHYKHIDNHLCMRHGLRLNRHRGHEPAQYTVMCRAHGGLQEAEAYLAGLPEVERRECLETLGKAVRVYLGLPARPAKYYLTHKNPEMGGPDDGDRVPYSVPSIDTLMGGTPKKVDWKKYSGETLEDFEVGLKQSVLTQIRELSRLRQSLYDSMDKKVLDKKDLIEYRQMAREITNQVKIYQTLTLEEMQKLKKDFNYKTRKLCEAIAEYVEDKKVLKKIAKRFVEILEDSEASDAVLDPKRVRSREKNEEETA